ncbi:MAG: apolipoprotein N-acyltransferase, partial [Actinomycetota bacterium]|nr:apolipoprotein N-acyltransferase [Actinomycetota bacterium]
MLQTRAAGIPGGAEDVPAPPAARRPVRRRTGARFAGAAASGALVLAAFPPYGFWPLAPVGVALLLLTVRGCRVGTGALLGLVHGLAFFVPLLQWSGIYVGPVPWLLLAGSQAAFLAGLGAALAAVSRGPAWPLAGALLWVAQEAVRMRLPWGGFPWGRLGFASADAPWVPLAALGGVPLVSFAVALV